MGTCNRGRDDCRAGTWFWVILAAIAVGAVLVGFLPSPHFASGQSSADREADHYVFVWMALNVEDGMDVNAFPPIWEKECRRMAGPEAVLELRGKVVIARNVGPLKVLAGFCFIPKNKGA